ncbi:TPA: LysR family transcriptional regulator [Staphylococcus aureus]
MNLNILKSFLVTSETKNLTKASELLNYSQSTVSTHIEKLERQLDVKLFYRKKYGMELTEEGLAYVKYAKVILDSNSEYEREIKGLYNKKVNISINMQESQYLYRYYNKISEWLAEHPYVNLKFKSAHSNFYIKEEIANFKSDISLITDEKIINSNLTAIPMKNSGGIALLPEFIVADELENKSLFQIDVDVDIPNLETTLIINPESNKQVLESFVKDVFL